MPCTYLRHILSHLHFAHTPSRTIQRTPLKNTRPPTQVTQPPSFCIVIIGRETFSQVRHPRWTSSGRALGLGSIDPQTEPQPYTIPPSMWLILVACVDFRFLTVGISGRCPAGGGTIKSILYLLCSVLFRCASQWPLRTWKSPPH